MATWDVLLVSSYRVLSNPHLLSGDTVPKTAMEFLEQIRSLTVSVTPSEKVWPIFADLVRETNATGNLVTDAMIAAVAIDRNCQLATFDQDFARFKGLKWFTPA